MVLRILKKIESGNRIIGVIAVSNSCNKEFFVSKRDLLKYRYINAKITSDLRILSSDIIPTVSKTELSRHKNQIILYHGSQGGIKGEINVNYSNRLCDFGKGFYLVDNINQAINRVCGYNGSYLYKYSLNMDKYSIYI